MLERARLFRMVCNLCPRRCGGERSEGAGLGVCGSGVLPRIARAALHFDEEPVISGSNGSGAVFFSGCALRCVYCQNYDISHDLFGKTVSVGRLREIYSELIALGARNINLVSASHFAPVVIESLSPKPPVPVIWNTSGYESVETIKALDGLVDVYLPDFKYADEDIAYKYSSARDYFTVAARAVREMFNQSGPVVIGGDGYIQSGVIIRHLILPSHIENTRRVLDYIADNFRRAWVSLMAQYTPMGNAAAYPEINRTLTQAEYDSAVEYMLKLGLENGFVQELGAADSGYTPAFDLTGC